MLYSAVYNYQNYDGSEVLISVGVTNLYIYLLVYFYTPGIRTQKQLQEMRTDANLDRDVDFQYRELQVPRTEELFSLHPEERLEENIKLRGFDEKPANSNIATDNINAQRHLRADSNLTDDNHQDEDEKQNFELRNTNIQQQNLRGTTQQVVNKEKAMDGDSFEI